MGIPALDDPEVVATAVRCDLPPKLARLLLLVTRAVDDKMKLAVGGGVAVIDAGYQRFTKDLDVFARPVSSKRLVRRLAAEGLKVHWITDAHAIAWLDEDNRELLEAREAPEVRVDVLSTITEPEASAIRTAVTPRSLGVPMKVFRPDHLAAIKFLAGRPQDLLDFDELIRRGVDLERVRYLVGTYDESKVAAVTARVRKMKKLWGLADPRGVYLARDEFERRLAAAAAAMYTPTAVTPPAAPARS
jgi:hypothetical protein